MDAFDLLRVDGALHAPAGKLRADHDAHDLDAAAGRTGARADEHQHNKQRFGKPRPKVEIRDSKARGAHHGRGGEYGVAECLAKAAEERQNVHSNGKRNGGENAEEYPHLLAAQRLPELADQQEIVEREVYGKEDHKNGDDRL